VRARALRIEQAWQVFDDRPSSPPFDDETAERIARIDVAKTEARIGTPAPLTVEDAMQMARDPASLALERALFAWEEHQRPTIATEPHWHLEWEPWFEGPCGLLLTPTANPWEVPAYTSFYGASLPRGHEALIRILFDWWERFGAELVASWGTELQFIVRRPPAEIDTAFALAVEQVKIAAAMIHPLGVTVRRHARALLGRGDWYLHERP
jgi:Domain of unknown function (DUF4253)